MIKGIGCDIVEINRFEELADNQKFFKKVYTEYEQERVKDSPVHTVAGIWAAKEAVSKALGTGFAGFKITDIEICTDTSGRPYVNLYGGAEQLFNRLGCEHIYISISHERSQAVAFCVIE